MRPSATQRSSLGPTFSRKLPRSPFPAAGTANWVTVAAALLSFSSRLGRSKAAAKGVVTNPAGDRQHGKGSELSGKISHQEMKLLDAAPFERDFGRERDRGETNSEAEEP